MNNFDFLTLSEVIGKDKLQIFEKCEARCVVTDFSILLGCNYGYIPGDNSNKAGWWWTKTRFSELEVMGITINGTESIVYQDESRICIRPAINYSKIEMYAKNKKINQYGVLEVEYGEYPQTIASEEESKALEYAYTKESLKQTGKIYTSDPRDDSKYGGILRIQQHIEYEFNSKKYIRMVITKPLYGKSLSNGRTIEKNQPHWVCVEPIKWLIDEKTNKAITEKLILTGIEFNTIGDTKGNFEDTDIYKFMEKYLCKEIIELDKNNKNKNISKINKYNFDYSQVSEEDIIKGAIESNIAVFLHGKSSEGKSARVKQIDHDCVIIYLRNATPESLNGKSVYNSETGEMIDIKPTWLKKLENVCEKEPDKNHIVFFDEITNALPSIQGIAFNIVLDKEVNGIWKLPDNARIVAAGNEMNDSLAANQLAEPLFNRFAHVYINTTVDKWLEWASKNNIHPAIYAYIAYRKDEALRSKYNGETPNADPRKWEMASNMLYKTSKPEMLRALLGTDITNEFIWFTKQKVITLEDVLNDNYSEEDFNLNTGEKYMTVVGLLNAKEEDYPKVLEFLKKLGSEFISIFNSLWSKDNEERLEIIAESKQDIKKKTRRRKVNE